MQLSTHTANKQLTPLERFVGEGALVLGSHPFTINNHIDGEWLEVAVPEEDQPEEQGKLFLYPIADGQFCMQLFYLQYADDSTGNASVCSLRFLPAFFDQYPVASLMANRPFRFDEPTTLPFSMCAQAKLLLAQLLQKPTATPLIAALQQTETAIHLLRRALECITVPFTTCQVPACRFLAYDSEREKIQLAQSLLDEHIDRPFTIRELSRKVAMNECYLKKGFKALVGKTIHEYQQHLRITKAKVLLQERGQSVTDVAAQLGYSSISHFSTAFKRATGLKPCELLA